MGWEKKSAIAPRAWLPELDSWSKRRDELRDWLRCRPVTGVGEDEVQAHFAGMPPHYWERVDPGELVWGLQAVHEFLRLLASPADTATRPVVRHRSVPPTDETQVVICTWDRHGLLAKAAAAFSAVRLNVLRAEAFTRSDNVVLDLFRVGNGAGAGPVPAKKLDEMTFLLEGALCQPPRLASMVSQSLVRDTPAGRSLNPRVTFDNNASPESTLIRIEAADRLGLLHDLLQAVADNGLEILEAQIRTEDGVARDILQVRDQLGNPVLAPVRLETLQRNLEAALQPGTGTLRT